MRRIFAAATAGTVLACAALAAVASPAAAHRGAEAVRVGYFTQWGIYGRAFTVKNWTTPVRPPGWAVLCGWWAR